MRKTTCQGFPALTPAGSGACPSRQTLSPNHGGKRERPGEITAGDLAALLRPYGATGVVHLFADRSVGWSRGFAFVEVAGGARNAVRALDGSEFRGRVLTVAEAETRVAAPGPRAARTTGR